MGKIFYDGLKKELESPADSRLTFKLPAGIEKDEITDADLIQAYSTIRNEWPELIYWADLGFDYYGIRPAGSDIWEFNYFIDPQENYKLDKTAKVYRAAGSGDEYFYWTLIAKGNNNDQKRAEVIAQGVLNDAPKGSDFDKVEYFNNWIIKNTEYDVEGLIPEDDGSEDPQPPYDNTFHIAGVFIDGKAVCEGYAKAFKYLCDKSNIECLYVTGWLLTEDGPGPHAWNYVKLDGAWYIVDTTNNDVPEDSPAWNRAFCIGSEAPFAQILLPDDVFDLENGVWAPVPESVTLSPTSYKGNVKEIVDFTFPNKLDEYFAGDELDLTDATVNVKYLDDTTETIAMTTAMLSGLDMNKVGTQSVTITVGKAVEKDAFTITIKNAPISITVRDAVTSYAPGVTSLDLTKGTVQVTYADPTDVTNIPSYPLGASNVDIVLDPDLNTVTGFPVGRYDIEVNLNTDVKALSTTYKITVGNPGGGGGGSSGGGGTSHADPTYPSADSGVKTLTDIKKVDLNNLPSGMTLAKTAANTPIGVIAISLNDNGGLDLATLTTLSKLPSTVGLMIKQGKGAVEIILPGGFNMTAEPGRFSYPLVYNPVAENKTEMLAAIKTKDARSDTLTIGGNVVLPVKATISVKTTIAEGSKLNVYRFDPATKKNVLVSTGKVVGGRIVFATSTLGQFTITTGSI